MTPAELIAEKHNAQVRAKPGHNSEPKLKEYVDRIVRLEEEKKGLADDIRDIKKEAKDSGLNPKAVAAAVKLSMETVEAKEKRLEFETDLDTYKLALGLLD